MQEEEDTCCDDIKGCVLLVYHSCFVLFLVLWWLRSHTHTQMNWKSSLISAFFIFGIFCYISPCFRQYAGVPLFSIVIALGEESLREWLETTVYFLQMARVYSSILTL